MRALGGLNLPPTVCDELNRLHALILNEQAVQKPRTVVMFQVL